MKTLLPTKTRIEPYVDILSGFAFDASSFSDSGDISVVRIRDVMRGRSETFYSGSYDVKYLVQDGELLVGMDGNFSAARWRGGKAVLNQRCCRVTADDVHLDSGYLFHLLPIELAKIEAQTPFVTVKHLSVKQIREIEVVLPPLEEQRRIAAILDQADALRDKRRQALALVEQLTQSVFLEMFDSTDFQLVEFNSLVQDVRNGVSPSTNGLYSSAVLTLSAVTQGAFDSKQRKEGVFDKVPPPNQTVRAGDLLICRGNGNRDLVGRGVVPRESHAGLVFPDTVIAVTPKAEAAPVYLETVWNLPSTRNQIVSRASTTNGTFKVNQKSLGQIKLPLPPLELQQEFARRVAAIEKLKAAHQQSLKEMDALFASLQHRAFRGEL